METTALARSMRGSIGMLAMAWLMDESTVQAAVERGMPSDGSAYAIGRLGVLGDCPVDNVVGAAFFWEPERMRSMVVAGRSTMSPTDGAAIYRDICEAWGNRVLDGFDGVLRLGELAERVVNGASPLGAPTFVGWRDQALPEPGPGRTFQLCQVLRELRFGRHTIAVQAAGMDPLDAILSGPAGPWNAEFFGWPPTTPGADAPYHDVSHLTEAREAVEGHTDILHGADFEVLTPDERAEFRNLAKAARAHASGDQK